MQAQPLAPPIYCCVFTRFNAVHPRVPVIIVTAHFSDHLTQSVAAAPHLSLLRKPFQYEELHALLHRRAMESLGA